MNNDQLRKSVPNQSQQHLSRKESSPPDEGCLFPFLMLLVFPSIMGIVGMIVLYKSGHGLGITLLGFVAAFITTIILLFSQVDDDNGPSSSTTPRITVQDAPLRTQMMAEDPDFNQADLINDVTNRPTTPHNARASVVRMPDGRVVVVSSNPVGGSRPSDPRTPNLPPQGGSGNG